MSTPDQTSVSRVAIVTGGYGVVVHYSGNKGAADEAVSAVRAAGGQAFAVQADIADEAAVTAVFDQAEQRFGGVDVVVHTAGQMKLAPLSELDLDDLDSTASISAAPSWCPSRRSGECELAGRS